MVAGHMQHWGSGHGICRLHPNILQNSAFLSLLCVLGLKKVLPDVNKAKVFFSSLIDYMYIRGSEYSQVIALLNFSGSADSVALPPFMLVTGCCNAMFILAYWSQHFCMSLKTTKLNFWVVRFWTVWKFEFSHKRIEMYLCEVVWKVKLLIWGHKYH